MIFNSFQVYHSVALVTSTILGSHYYYEFPKLIHCFKHELCSHYVVSPYPSLAPNPGKRQSVSNFKYSRYFIEVELCNVCSFVSGFASVQ